ncbi:MAG: hypothetical protein KF887_09865 [Paracoccaceae bacterium]|nr:MAG: hypothetical protein KF887_09865 [Paracoccaceae bacterium]
MGMLKRFALVATLAVFPVAAAATVTQYQCKFATGTARDGNWIPTQLVLNHNAATGEIIVFDPVIKHFVGAPIAATLSGQTAARSTYTWTVDARRGLSERQQARMVYTFSYYSNGRPARMTAAPSGYDNQWTGEGTCQAKRG